MNYYPLFVALSLLLMNAASFAMHPAHAPLIPFPPRWYSQTVCNDLHTQHPESWHQMQQRLIAQGLATDYLLFLQEMPKSSHIRTAKLITQKLRSSALRYNYPLLQPNSPGAILTKNALIQLFASTQENQETLYNQWATLETSLALLNQACL